MQHEGLSEISFIDLLEPHACAIPFVPKHGPKRAQPHIQHKLGHVSLRECKGVHVADEDGTVLPHECRGLFMQKVFFGSS
ncbi:hypothetical protein ACTMU2_17630 [Cupriavidus basilensis]